MKREVITTKDGVKTLFVSDLNETYHSKHGVLQEAFHVFIKNGLNLLNYYDINILEIGLGTGINAFSSFYDELLNQTNRKINYYTLEKYPILWQEILDLDYFHLKKEYNSEYFFKSIHQSNWEEKIEISENFHFTKFKKDFFEIDQLNLPKIDLVYFDAFGSRVQPELWEIELIEKISKQMKVGGLFTTYSSKGSLRRILLELNFEVEKRKGPEGKREMLIAWKK